MRSIAAWLLLTLALTSCNDSKDERRILKNSTSRPVLRKLDNSTVPNELLTLKNESSNHHSGDSLRGNLYGRFFCDRAEFYTIDNPQNEIYSQRPATIVLYYLDGELCQTKYELKENIADKLFNELGRCRIVGFDTKNKQIISANGMRVDSPSGLRFNPDLDNYELTWNIGDKQIKYRVEKTKDESKFIYKEKLKNYEREFNIIAKYC